MSALEVVMTMRYTNRRILYYFTLHLTVTFKLFLSKSYNVLLHTDALPSGLDG